MDTKAKVGIIITDKDGRVLLIKEKLEKKPIALWNIIKGSYDGDETIFEAAKRECLEETCLNVELIHSLGVYVSEESGKIRIQFNFLAKTDNNNAEIASKEEQRPRNEAIEEVRWFTKEEIGKMNSGEFVSTRSFELLQDWISGELFPLSICKQVEM